MYSLVSTVPSGAATAERQNRMSRRVLLKDVADAAGVHISTVSRALDPGAKAPVSEELSRRVKKAAEDLGYMRNRIAASLRTNRSMTIGVMVPDITNAIYPPIIRGIESVLEPLGYASILVNTDNIPERETQLLEVLRQRGVDGIITGAAHLNDPGIAETVAEELPIVTLIRRLQESPVPYVIHDDEYGIRCVVQHLFALGHRQIAHIAGPLRLSTGQMRRHAYQTSCATLGLKDSETRIAISSGYEEAEGERCTLELLASYPETTAIVCGNDRLALGAYEGLLKIGKSVPDDVSVTGFNDSPMLTRVKPGLTTVRVKQYEAGQAAARHLLTAIEGDAPTAIGTVLPVSLIERDSTAAPRQAT